MWLFLLLRPFMALRKICINKNGGLKLRGFTIIEILIVMFLFALLSGTTLVFGTNYYREYNFYSEENLLISLLQKARSQAQNNINQKPHGIFFDKISGNYVLFQGVNYEHRDSDWDLVTQPNANFTMDGLDEVVFSQLSGNVEIPGDIILDNHKGSKITIKLNSEGQIDAN